MICLTLLSILLLSFETVKSDYNEWHCSYSNYMLNFLNLSQYYLFKMDENHKNFTEEDLNEYAQAVQSHGDVVLMMIEDLRKRTDNYFPLDLMTVNLYLNNTSGSILVDYKQRKGNSDNENNKVFLGIQGLKLLMNSITTRIEQFIDPYCKEIPQLPFVKYLKIKPDQFDKYSFKTVTKILRERIIEEIDPQIVNSNNIEIFHPRNVLFYDLMINQEVENPTKGTESRKHQEFVDGKPKYILDLLRFAPLSIQCDGNTHLTVMDVFRYAKYQYLYVDMRAFQRLVLGATYYPVGMLIVDYVHFATDVFHKGLHYQDPSKKGSPDITSLGTKISAIQREFIDLKLFTGTAVNFLEMISKKVLLIENCFTLKGFRIENSPEIILGMLESFMEGNKLKYDKDSKLIVTNENLAEVYGKILEKANQVELYVRELKKHAHSLNLIHDIQLIKKMCITDYKFFLLPNLTDKLCEENPLDDCSHTHDESDADVVKNEFNLFDVGNDDGLDTLKLESKGIFEPNIDSKKKKFTKTSLNQLYDFIDYPRHMIDYFISC